MRAEYDGLLHVLDKAVLSVFVIKIATKMVYRGERFFTEGMEWFRFPNFRHCGKRLFLNRKLAKRNVDPERFLVDETMDFIKIWLTRHVLQADLEYVPFVKWP